MTTLLNWKKGFFKSTYQIFAGNVPIGYLRENTWSQTAEGEINGKRYSFKISGFFNPKTTILDSNGIDIIGTITYSSWMTKATITLKDTLIQWKYDNAWNTKWSMTSSDGTIINYKGSSSKGSIEYLKGDEGNELHLLTGLYITNYYWQITFAVLVACFVPIMAATAN